ncbi:hypothetical protein V1283_003789 [Bradyrhizobium sp. AZCC 2262]|uniref:hypothetical protein n=1 Tax=Bradyrhizobium sp. AZCC 2262 TaxID=3117022 RepID=UPI002FF199FE
MNHDPSLQGGSWQECEEFGTLNNYPVAAAAAIVARACTCADMNAVTLVDAGIDMQQLAHVAERALMPTPQVVPAAICDIADVTTFCTFARNRLSEPERRYYRLRSRS